MKRFFICLANSKKYFQRCIAGIELKPSQERGRLYDVVRRGDEPVWIRPVSKSGHGEVATELVQDIKLLDVVEVNVTQPAPVQFQTENVLFVQEHLPVVYRVPPNAAALDKLLTHRAPPLFGNMQKALHRAEVSGLEYSLTLIKPENPQLLKMPTGGSTKIRASFIYCGVSYTLPLTDIDAEERALQDEDFLSQYNHVYFTLSLTPEYKEQHYKLVAGIVNF